jgi:hypothetical protein
MRSIQTRKKSKLSQQGRKSMSTLVRLLNTVNAMEECVCVIRNASAVTGLEEEPLGFGDGASDSSASSSA